MDIDSIILKHVLKNAYDYGKANPGAVVGKVINEFPDCKRDMKATMGKISRAVAEANALPKSELEARLSKFTFEKKEERGKTLELPDAVEGGVVTRFPPEPSGYLHIGHAKAAFLDYECAKTYGGKMLLRLDDTNPEKESQEYVDEIKKWLKWLGIEWSSESYTSDNIPKLYEYGKKLIAIGKAYVTTAPQDEISKMRTDGKPVLKERNASAEENLALFEKMLSGKIGEGGAVVLYKGDLSSQNTVMRDPALFRIIKKPHYRQGTKYAVWPSYDMDAPVMDSLEGVTHAMRSKEYELRDELYYSILRDLNLREPRLVGFSRLSIKNAPISKRLITPLVKEGRVSGWDDPRLPTLAGLKRRGIKKEAIRSFVLSFGLSKVESNPSWEKLLSENRKLVDPVAKRFFFVADPVELHVNGFPTELEGGEVEVRMHPKQEMGFRKVPVSGKLLISNSDVKQIKKGEMVRLKDLCNIKVTSIKSEFSSRDKLSEKTVYADFVSVEGQAEKKMQWVSGADGGHIGCDVLVPGDLLKDDGAVDPDSMKTIMGYCEPSCASLQEGEVVQFERFGFCVLDAKIGGRLVFIYTC
ncbi:MAG: glutamate--tRNA ligase [Candidatus Bilamarchaeaceae archaeon]